MTLHTHAGPLPTHQYVWLDADAIGKHEPLRAVWFGLTSFPGRAFGCHVLLECGAVYRSVPLHRLSSIKDAPPWAPAQAQTWDAYGYQFSLLEYPYLSSMNARARLQDGSEESGMYLFTLAPVGDAFSAAPSQSKEFYFLQLESGRFTAQPTNHVLIEDRSFTTALEWPKFLRRQEGWHSAEDSE